MSDCASEWNDSEPVEDLMRESFALVASQIAALKARSYTAGELHSECPSRLSGL